MNETQQPHGTEDVLDFEQVLVQASRGKRFANYIIDLIAFYLLVFLLSIVLAIFFPQFFRESAERGDLFDNPFIDRIVTLIFYGFYMSVIEAIFKDKSFGKFITGTRAVNHDGSRITAGTAFSRGFSRAVPFEPFSGLGDPSYPWHDKWTDTYVIDEKQSQYDHFVQ